MRNNTQYNAHILVVVVGVLFAARPSFGQILEEPIYVAPQELVSEIVDNPSQETLVVPVGTVRIAGAPWIRVRIGDYELGRSSYITISSFLDGQAQRLDARSLPDWSDWSAAFNGDEVEVTLHVAPGEFGIFVLIDEARSPQPPPDAEPGVSEGGVATICNDFDDRGASNDPRVARLRKTGVTNGFCTAWLVSNGAVLSAGHCLVVAGDLIEFNVPVSQANGTNVAAAVSDQYPVLASPIQSENNGLGEDWVMFRVGPNSNTGLRAHIAQGFFYMTKLTPNAGTTLRVTGYGLDNIPSGVGGAGSPCCDADADGDCDFNCNATSQTQQSTTGPMDDLEDDTIEHDVDTMPANSGSPIIWEGSDGYTFGIHTSGGCDDFFAGYDNHGTHLHRGPLEAALQNFLGPNTIYVDWAITGLPANGSVYEPLRTVSSAVAAVADGGIIAMVPGSYPKSAGNTFVAGADGKAMTFIAPVGTVVIGN